VKVKERFNKNNNNNNNNNLNNSDITENNNYDNNKENPNSVKEITPSSNQDLTNNTNISNEIIDIDDSPDVATWNKEVTRKKGTLQNHDNNYILTKINPTIPKITTIGLARKKQVKDIEKFSFIDPANQQDIDKAYTNGDILTDKTSFLDDKRKSNKNKG
jgi:hypothetical protein